MILKICIGNAVIGWIWTKGYIVGYVPNWLPAKREEIRTIVLILIENLHAFGKGEPNLEKILSFLITPEMIISLLTGLPDKEQGSLLGYLTRISSRSAMFENVLIFFIYPPSLSRENNMLFMAICFQCGKQFIFQCRAYLDL